MSDDDKPEWLGSLPEQMRDLPFIGKAQSMDEAINHIKDAADMMGNSLRIPSPNAGDEDRKKFQERVLEKFPDLMPVPDPEDSEAYAKVLERLGAPADPKDFPVPEIEGFDWDEEFLADLRAKAQAAGMTKRQFKEYATQVGKELHESGLSRQQQLEAQQAELQKEWGEAFDTRKQQLNNYLEQTEAPAELREAVKNGTAAPATMKWLHSMVAKAGKEGAEGHEQGGPDGPEARLTPEEANARISEILNNPDYFQPGPKQQLLMKEMAKMQRLANPQR